MISDNIRNWLQQLRLVLRNGDDTLSLANYVAYAIFGDRTHKLFCGWSLRFFDRMTGLDEIDIKGRGGINRESRESARMEIKYSVLYSRGFA